MDPCTSLTKIHLPYGNGPTYLEIGKISIAVSLGFGEDVVFFRGMKFLKIDHDLVPEVTLSINQFVHRG